MIDVSKLSLATRRGAATLALGGAAALAIHAPGVAQASARSARTSTAAAAAARLVPAKLSPARVKAVDNAWTNVVDAEYDGAYFQSGRNSRDYLCRALAPYARGVYTRRFAGRSSSSCGSLFDVAFKVAWEGFAAAYNPNKEYSDGPYGEITGLQEFFTKVSATRLRELSGHERGHLFVKVVPVNGWLTSTWFVLLDGRWRDDSMPPLVPRGK